LNEPSRTDWKKLEAMTDEEIDYSDIPPLDESFFERARQWLPKQKIAITMQVDSDVLAWFKAEDDWEERMQAALRIYVEAHKEYR
jgi:uncharacterized protein (DUF4415 family)